MRAVILQILRKPQGMIGDYSASETVDGVTPPNSEDGTE